MEWTVKNVKSFRGREGDGFNATLYRDGKRVALVDDAANGGCYSYTWFDRNADTVVEIHVHGYKGEPRTYKGSPEEKLFAEYCDAQTYKDKDHVVAVLVDEYQASKWLRSKCRKQTLFRLKGDAEGNYRTVRAPYSDAVRDYLRGKYGDRIEAIANEHVAA